MKRTKKHVYDLIVSIGSECFTTTALRDSNMQKYSFPFDWLFGNNIYFRLDTILNEFKGWFNKEDLIDWGTREYPCPCHIYKNDKTQIIYNHDFPIDKDFDIAYPEVCEKYQRRIDRLLKLFKKSRKVLLVYMIDPVKEETFEKDVLFEYLDKFNSKYPKTKFDLLFVECSDKKELEGEEFTNGDSVIYRYNIDFRSPTFDLGVNSWDFEAFRTLLSSFKFNDRTNPILKITSIKKHKKKKGLRIIIFPKIPTLFNVFLYFLGIRLDIYIGKQRNLLP